MAIERIIDSPLGRLRLLAENGALAELHFSDGRDRAAPTIGQSSTETAILDRTERELAEYFSGARTEFTVPLLPQGTEFQRAVWRALVAIPFGATCSYLDVARRVNNPDAVRAVGRANGQNPIAIIVPCHRVIGSDGSMTGYGGGIEKKRWLLEHEARVAGAESGISPLRTAQPGLPFPEAP
jgi:methylated-DNA-[protein]-cysteine S-methyltransferase